jgi:adenosine deaminase
MWEVIRYLKPDRIGHGIRSVDDAKLMNYLARHNIVLEVCPTSNIQTSAVSSWDEMGEIIVALKHHKVPFTVNSDGPELLGTNVKEEFERLLVRKILTEDDVVNCTVVARKATFVQ